MIRGFLLCILCLITGAAYAIPMEFAGNTSFYLWDDPGQQQLSQRIYLSTRPGDDLLVKVSGRTSLLLDPSEKQWRLDEASLQWSVAPDLRLQVGRNHPTIGASQGLLDGVEVRYQVQPRFAAALFGGIVGNHYRRRAESYGKYWVVGTGFSYRALPIVRAEIYATHEGYGSRTFRQQLGWSGMSRPLARTSLSTFGRLDLKNQEIAYTTVSAGYELIRSLRFSLDYYHSEPRLPAEIEDVRLPKYQEASSGIDWYLWRVIRLRASIGGIQTFDERGHSERASIRWRYGKTSLNANLHQYQLGVHRRFIWSVRLRQLLFGQTGIAARYRRFAYEYQSNVSTYRSHTFGGELDLVVGTTWHLSVASEYIWRESGRVGDARIYGNVRYRFVSGNTRH